VDDPDDGTYSRAPEPEDVVRICLALIRTKDTRRPQDAIDRTFLEGVIRERELVPES